MSVPHGRTPKLDLAIERSAREPDQVGETSHRRQSPAPCQHRWNARGRPSCMLSNLDGPDLGAVQRLVGTRRTQEGPRPARSSPVLASVERERELF